MVPQEHKKKALPKPKEAQDQKDYQPETDEDSSIMKIESLPLMLLVSDNNGNPQYKDIDQLPFTVQTELEKRFEKYRTTSDNKIKVFRRLINNPTTYIDRPYCVCDQLARGLIIKRGGEPIPNQKFELGGKLGARADDKCVKDNIPCTHLINHKGSYALCFVPLPRSVRKGSSWNSLGHWVLN